MELRQLSLDLQAPRKPCPGPYMCPGSYGFRLWGTPAIWCEACGQEKLLRPPAGGEGGTPPSEGAEAP